MNEGRKRAYRYLLYWAMVDIRNLCQSRGGVTLNPRKIWEQYQLSRQAGALADWLHNLAYYSQVHFQRFDEERFWREYEGFKSDFPQYRGDYKELFDDELKRWQEKRR